MARTTFEPYLSEEQIVRTFVVEKKRPAPTMRLRRHGPNHSHVATTLEKMAELYTKTGRDDEAKKLLDRAKRIRANQ